MPDRSRASRVRQRDDEVEVANRRPGREIRFGDDGDVLQRAGQIAIRYGVDAHADAAADLHAATIGFVHTRRQLNRRQVGQLGDRRAEPGAIAALELGLAAAAGPARAEVRQERDDPAIGARTCSDAMMRSVSLTSYCALSRFCRAIATSAWAAIRSPSTFFSSSRTCSSALDTAIRSSRRRCGAASRCPAAPAAPARAPSSPRRARSAPTRRGGAARPRSARSPIRPASARTAWFRACAAAWSDRT